MRCAQYKVKRFLSEQYQRLIVRSVTVLLFVAKSFVISCAQQKRVSLVIPAELIHSPQIQGIMHHMRMANFIIPPLP